MARLTITLLLALAVIPGTVSAAGLKPFRPTVIIEPGDVSPLAPPPDGPRRAVRSLPPPTPDPAKLRLDAEQLESRVRRSPPLTTAPADIDRELGAVRLDQRTETTRRPGNAELGVLGRRLDWLDDLQRRAAERRRRASQVEPRPTGLE